MIPKLQDVREQPLLKAPSQANVLDDLKRTSLEDFQGLLRFCRDEKKWTDFSQLASDMERLGLEPGLNIRENEPKIRRTLQLFSVCR